ncbi:MAG: hypothetical protein ABJC04_01125 [Verrucomicrobiota bacterium]
MKFFPLLAIFCAAFLSSAHAQVNAVTVELTLDQEQYLANEDMRVGVKVINLSGQPISLGTDNEWLSFTVQARDQFVVSQLSEIPVKGEFSVPSSKQAIKRLNLTPYFDFRQPGRYQITAKVKIAQWDKEITSHPLTFDIVMGTKLKEFDFGVPSNSTNAAPEIRRYILQQATFLRQMRLYLRLTDDTGSKVFRVFPLAPMTSFSNPEAQVDKTSNLHVLNQTGAKSFSYTVVNPNGEIIKQETHDYSNTRPVLRSNAEGNILVVGGTLRLTSNAVPKLSTPQSPEKDAEKH